MRGASEGFGDKEDDDVTGERVDDADDDEQHLLPAATGRASVPAAAGFIALAILGAVSQAVRGRVGLSKNKPIRVACFAPKKVP